MTLVQDNSVQAINTALLSIKRDVSALTATTSGTTAGLEQGKTYNINISGNAETATTAKTARTATNANHAETAETVTKMSNALTVNGKTYDGSSAVDAGVQTVANGGTGATNAADGFNTLADGVRDSSAPTDDEKMLLKPAGTWYKTTCLDFWNYIKGKISSVLGLTADNYGGKADTAESANYLFYTQGNEINFKGGAPGSCYFNYRNADTGGPSPVDTMAYIFCNYSGDTSKSVIKAGSFKSSSKMVIPIGAPSSLEDGCIWIER